ncbi:MATE family efflux transporter [Novosphingobium mangrovi (ex Hu et al. 2023)]|uniref:MATE family efflux transporter n=1 Tax=Novosphingobium mangrovi (ex Hu et al. 2023) TaxID=2930094 RepID=A0ABT0AF44_9SPHN|nr:MATE family efflux transporter [Novosphingobium mangrovi (ex Hu et al. 2023)]MCJ1961790.1 MATE family efflux transporter [Novosphingobium mangrovi (ex Hu et al. 2023)]
MSHSSTPPSLSAQLWSIAFPAMLTNVATALFGLADMWAIGRLGDPAAQGAVELGAKFTMGLLNVFNFLRTGTIALTAQGSGRSDFDAQATTLVRALAVALGIGVLLIGAMPLAIPAGLDFLGAHGPLREEAQAYVALRYWAAPLWLLNCVLIGWLVGQRMVRHVLAVEITTNVVHVALDLVLVLGAGWGVEGVALASLLSEGLRLVLLIGIALHRPASRIAARRVLRAETWQRSALARLFALNRDLFLRTLLLTGAMMLFARTGAQAGPVTLAANGILFQLFMLATLLLDGFENAAQVLCGEAYGAREARRFRHTVRLALSWGAVMGCALSLIYLAAAPSLADAFTASPQVRAASQEYIIWIMVLPAVGMASFVLDGVFVGAGWTRAMMGTMAVALALYIALLWLLSPLGNHGLWLAFTVLFIARAAGQFAVLPRLTKRAFAES